MVIPKVQIQSIKATAQSAGGINKLKCAIKCVGELNAAAAEELKVNLSETKRMTAFEITREKGEVSLDFKIAQLTMGDEEDGAPSNFSAPGRQALLLKAASLHRYKCARDDNGVIKVTMTATFDSSYWPVASEFMKTDSGALLDLTIAPEQKDLFPEEKDLQTEPPKKRGRKKASKKKAAETPPEVVH